jgi:integrase
MDGRKLPGASDGNSVVKRRKKKGGLECRQISCFWWVYGTLRLKDRSVRLRKSLGIPADRPQHEAEAARAAIENQYIAESVFGVKPSATFATITLSWLNTALPGATDILMSKVLVKRFGAKMVRDIVSADIAEFIASMANRKPATINRYLNPLHAILSLGVRLGYADTLPHFERPRVKKTLINKMLSMPEIDTLFDGLAPHAQDVVALLGTSGCRVSEAVYLQIPDVILADGRERVIFRNTKNGETYGAAMHPFAVPFILRAIGKRREGAVFLTDKGVPYKVKAHGGGQIKTAWRKARAHLVTSLKEVGQHDRAAVVAQATPHWLRHTFASHLMAQGETVKTIMEAGRWKTARLVWETYGHLAPDATRDAVNSLPFGRNKADEDRKEGKIIA